MYVFTIGAIFGHPTIQTTHNDCPGYPFEQTDSGAERPVQNPWEGMTKTKVGAALKGSA
jgi:hypothetical protein